MRDDIVFIPGRVYITIYDSGNKCTISPLDCDNQRHGRYRWYDDSGNILMRTHFWHGKVVSVKKYKRLLRQSKRDKIKKIENNSIKSKLLKLFNSIIGKCKV